MLRLLTILTLLVIGAALPLGVSAAQTRSLAGTSWVLREYSVQRAAPVPAVGDQRPTLVFGANGQVSGTTGCNSFSGTYTQAADTLTFGPLAMTQRACIDAAITAQEQLVTRVLSSNPVAYTWQGSQLALSSPPGSLTYLQAVVQNGGTPSTLPSTGANDPLFGWPVLFLALGAAALGLGARLRLRTRRLQ